MNAPAQFITVNPNPISAFSVSDVCLEDSAYLDNSSTIPTGSILTSIWSYGDQSGDTTYSPVPHFYTDTGNYLISLVSISELGCADSVLQSVWVHPKPKALFSVPDVCFTHASQFTDLSVVGSGNIVGWEWSFPDAPQNSSDQHPEHLFSTDGSLPVLLVATTEFGCVDSISDVAVVHPLPILSVNHENRCFGESVEFNGQSSISSGNIDSYVWDLGNDFTLNTLDAVHYYEEPGFYNAQLSAISNLGCSGSTQIQVEIFELPIAGFTAFPETEGCEPFTVTFIDSSSIPYPYYIASRSWGFRNGSVSDQIQPTFVYDIAGVYDVDLTVESNKGCLDSILAMDYITVHPNPEAGFSFSPVEISVFFSDVTFLDLSNGAITWDWSFGDGQFSTERNPTHFYPDTGDFRVIQIVSNEFQCKDTAETILVVWPQPTFYIPNAFSPNNDGINETFFGQGYGIKELAMKIFNRWGEELFVANDLNTGWDGTYNGQPVEQGVYVYLITTISVEGEYKKHVGHVTLER